MSKRRTAHKISGQFAPRTIEMLRSPAMRVLSLTARRILDRLEIEHAAHGGRDNGRLPVTYADLVEFGITDRKLITPGIRELCALGFVVLTKPGRSGNGAHRTPNLFRITYLPARRAAPTNEWCRIETVAEAERIARESRRTSPKNRPAGKHFPGGKIPPGPGGKIPPATRGENPPCPPVSPGGKTTPLSRLYPSTSLSQQGEGPPPRRTALTR